ncbi:MAG: Rne/Rng family ribonuclease [Pseudomonadota bacterium]
MKRILVNATQQEELRLATVDGQKLYDLDIETPSREQKKGNIYKGRITRIERSLEAAFVDYGAERHGFLPLKEVARSYFQSKPDGGSRIDIKEVLREGQEVVVQVEKEERGNKGAALTTFISLAGRFLVLMPNNPRAGGVSRRIEAEDRAEMREILASLDVPEGMGLIVRTAGVGRSQEELDWDLRYLMSLWTSIEEACAGRSASFLVYQDSNLMIRALRDHFNADIGEILIDDPTVFKDAKTFVEQVMPTQTRRVKLYEDEVPLFTRFQIESQIESAFAHTVSLPSGGSIVIDPTEALVSIDINSARATKGDDIETTALNTNLEAADEIARQLRLRDIGGLIVIDFIDMGPSRNQREVENRLREAVKMDRARIQIGRISRFGLLEMSRQRLRPSLEESATIVCPRCNGQGYIRDVESLSLACLRLIGEEARKDKTALVVAQVPVEVGTYLLNEKRENLASIETRTGVRVVMVPTPKLETPNYNLRRVRTDEVDLPENADVSYRLAPPEEEDAPKIAPTPPARSEAPAVQNVVPDSPAPAPSPDKVADQPEPQPGVITKMMAWMSGVLGGEAQDETPAEDPAPKARSRTANGSRRGGGPSGGRAANGSSGSGQSRSAGAGGRKRGGRRSGSSRRTEGDGTRSANADSRSARDGDNRTEGGSRRSRSRRGSGGGEENAGANASNEQQQSRRSRGGRGGNRRGNAAGDGENAAAVAAAATPDAAVEANAKSEAPKNEPSSNGPQDGTNASPEGGERPSGRRRGRRGGRRRRRGGAGTGEGEGAPNAGPDATQQISAETGGSGAPRADGTAEAKASREGGDAGPSRRRAPGSESTEGTSKTAAKESAAPPEPKVAARAADENATPAAPSAPASEAPKPLPSAPASAPSSGDTGGGDSAPPKPPAAAAND